MEINYHLFDPTGNVTVLVETGVPAAEQPAVAAALLKAEPSAEQAGFLSGGGAGCDIALRMAGGEFCGNAAMSAAAFYALRRGREAGTVRVRVSGAEAPVAVRLEALGGSGAIPAARWRGTVEMPRPLSVARENLPGGGSPFVVRFPGIAHVIFPRGLERADAEAAVRGWCAVLEAEALGLMLLDRNCFLPSLSGGKETESPPARAPVGEARPFPSRTGGKRAEIPLTPLVYVPAGDTLYWERSCASGTSAVGAYLAAEAGAPITAALAEPGGILEVSAAPDGAVSLTGTVRYLREGVVTL